MNDVQDDKIWEVYAQGVRKLNVKGKAPSPKPVKPATRKKKEAEQPPFSPPSPSLPLTQPPRTEDQGLDVRVERNLSLGDVVIEARLDLHGKSEAAAHDELCAFIEKNHALGKRIVLIITGKGRDGVSPLRINLPRWCTSGVLADFVRAVRAAAPQHGGDGAYYVLLRRKT